MEGVKKSLSYISSLIYNLPFPTFAIDKNGVVIAWNRTMEEISGVKAKNMVVKGGVTVMGAKLINLVSTNLSLNTGKLRSKKVSSIGKPIL